MSSVRLPSWVLGPLVLLGAVVAGQAIGLLDEGETIPIPIQLGQSLVGGAAIALVAVGVVLVYRATRVVNFAQAGFGTAGAMLFLCLASLWQWPVLLAAPAAVIGAGLAGVLIEILVIRRFARAPRLVLTVATIAIAQALAGLTLFMPRLFGLIIEVDRNGGGGGGPQIIVRGTGAQYARTAPGSPFDGFNGEWFPWQWDGDDIFVVVAALAAMAALAWFFRATPQGVAVRGAAENTDRAALLGINTGNLSSLVWGLATALAAVGAVAMAMQRDSTLFGTVGRALTQGGSLADAVGVTLLLRALTAAVVARMENLPLAVATAFGISILEASVFWTSGQNVTVDAALLVIIVVSLLVQRSRGARIEAAATSSWEATEEIRGVPAELAPVPQVRNGIRRAVWTIGLIVVAYPWAMSPAQTSHGAVFALYGIIGVSLVVLTGWGGQISLGQFAFAAIGALVGGAVTGRYDLPFALALLLGSLAAAAVAVGVGIPALRIRGLFLAVSTLGFAVAVGTVVMNHTYFGWLFPDTVPRPKLLWFDTDADERTFYYLCVAALAFAIFVATSLRRSRTGRVLIAMRDNEQFARSHGIDVVRTRLAAFGVSGFLAGLAGVLYVHHQESLILNSYGPDQSISMFLMAVIGGLGNVYTVLVGALYLGITTVVIDNAYGRLLASALGVLTILLFYPQGLGAVVYRMRDSWLRRVALRNRIVVPSLLGNRVDATKVALGERLADLGDVPEEYVLPSEIGTAGRSQLARVWKYD